MPFLLLSLSIVILSQSAIFIRYAEAPAAAIGFWRLVIALAVLGPIVAFRKGDFKSLLQGGRKQTFALIACAFFLFAHFYTWFLSVQKTSVANSMILFSTNPLYTALGAWLIFREKIYPRHMVSLLLCFGGLFFMMRESLQFKPENFMGDLLGFVCAVMFSAYILASKSLRNRLANPPFAFATYAFCTLFFALAMLWEDIPFSGYSQQSWLAFWALAIGSTLLGHSLFTHCLKYFNINLMSCSTLVEPMISAYSAWLLFHEPLTAAAVIGFIFVTVGILTLYWPYLKNLLRKKECA